MQGWLVALDRHRVGQSLRATKLPHILLEGFHQTADLLSLGGASHRHGFFDFGPSGRQLGCAQFHASFLDQFANPNLFGRIVLLVEIIGIAFPSRRFSKVRPATDLVSGALVISRIDEGFDHRDGMAPSLLPVLGEPPEHELHEAADEVGPTTIGQDQQTGIIGQESAAAAALFATPADELVSILNVEGCCAPTRHGQSLAFVKEGVAHVLTHEG